MKGIPVKRVEGGLGARMDISGLTQDSRKVEKGFLFVAIAGEKQDGHDFVSDAVKKGASAVVAVRRTGAGVRSSSCSRLAARDTWRADERA